MDAGLQAANFCPKLLYGSLAPVHLYNECLIVGAYVVDQLLHLTDLLQEESQVPGHQRAASSRRTNLWALHSD